MVKIRDGVVANRPVCAQIAPVTFMTALPNP